MLVLDEYKMQLGALNETLALAHKQMNADALNEELKTLGCFWIWTTGVCRQSSTAAKP